MIFILTILQFVTASVAVCLFGYFVAAPALTWLDKLLITSDFPAFDGLAVVLVITCTAMWVLKPGLERLLKCQKK